MQFINSEYCFFFLFVKQNKNIFTDNMFHLNTYKTMDKTVVLYEIYRVNWKRVHTFVHCLYLQDLIT